MNPSTQPPWEAVRGARHPESGRQGRTGEGSAFPLCARIFCAGLLSLAALSFVPAVRADRPKISNARLETRSAASGFEPIFREFLAAQSDPAWMAYSAPAIPGHHPVCCDDGWSDDYRASCGRCSLESDHGSNHTVTGDRGVQHLEGPGEMAIFVRVAAHHVTQVRVFSPECEIEGAGLRVLWLTDVKPAESVAALAVLVPPSFRGEDDSRHAASGALAAIAMHADPAADRALDSFTSADQPEKLRQQAGFWLGSARGATGLHILERMAKSDPSSQVRSQVAFDFSVSREPGAIDDMIRLAHDDESEHVRGQALFWLAQKAGKRAAGAITDAIENDPDTKLKKSAVFALTQMPPDEGVPLLIQVARNNKNPEVRKQAFFWLGQSKDPRALAFFEEVLSR